MNYQMPSSQTNFHSMITHEQLEQVIKAISDGRYSWACVLILRFIGYNPLHFIPQRTYSRLMKEHNQFRSAKLDSEITGNSSENSNFNQEEMQIFQQSNYLETSDTKQKNTKGGKMPFYLQSNLATLSPSKVKDLQN